MTQRLVQTEEILTEVEREIQVLIRASLQEFMRLHRDKMHDHTVVFYPLNIVGTGAENPTVFVQTIALVPTMETYPAETSDAVKACHNIRIEYNIYNNKPLNG